MMTTNEKNIFAQKWLTLCLFYGKELSEQALRLQVESLSKYPLAALMTACDEFQKENKRSYPPTPADIARIMSPSSVTDEDIAIELARKIVAAIKKFGWTWEQGFVTEGKTLFSTFDRSVNATSFKEAMDKTLGPIAWAVVQHFGGWLNLHNSFFESDEGQFHPQLRDHIESVIRRSKAGTLNEIPQLPGMSPAAKLTQNLGLENKGSF